MTKPFVVTFAVIAILILGGLTKQSSRAIEDHGSLRAAKNTVNYGGVSFLYDSSLAKDVTCRTVPAVVSGKPSDIWPEHPAFAFMDAPRPLGMEPTGAQLRVFSIKKFREAVDTASRENAKTALPPGPSWTVDFDEEVRVLKALLAARPTSATVQEFLKRTRNKDDFNQGMPFLPMWEAQQAFTSHIKYLQFQKGKGVIFLTQWDTETSQVTNDGLEYAFQGITDDGDYYIYAEFSVEAPILPNENQPEVVAWNRKNYLLPRRSKEYQDYLRPVVSNLESLSGEQFNPKLDLFEQLIASLRVETR